MSTIECIKELLNAVSTPYTAFVGDDDFLVPRTIDRCVHYLERHPDFVAANGTSILTNLHSSGAYGEVVSTGNYRLPSLTEESASQRLLTHLKNYSVSLFSVHRTDSWHVMCSEVSTASSILDSSFSTELLPCCLSVTIGKIKSLDYLYLVRQDHRHRYRQPDIFDWITKRDWASSFDSCRDYLADMLVHKDQIPLNEAKELVKQAFWAYLAQSLSSKWATTYIPTHHSVNTWRNLAKLIPGACLLSRVLHSFRSPRFSLPDLLNPSSPYHTDFMPVYRAFSRSSFVLPGEI